VQQLQVVCSDVKTSLASANGKAYSCMIFTGIDMLRYIKMLNNF